MKRSRIAKHNLLGLGHCISIQQGLGKHSSPTILPHTVSPLTVRQLHFGTPPSSSAKTSEVAPIMLTAPKRTVIASKFFINFIINLLSLFVTD
jgi:hypothetical protein